MQRRRVTIGGRVQGVFFRASCAAEARRRGLSGWVRNLPDGRVEAVFEGDDDDVSAMVDWCGGGPPDAVVESAESSPEPPTGEVGFRIRG
jgi:acylphosphatase